MRELYAFCLGVAAMALLSVDAARVSAQVYAPQPPSSAGAPANFTPYDARPINGPSNNVTGNPFLNSAGPRPTLLAPSYDDQVRQASFDQPSAVPPRTDDLTPIEFAPQPQQPPTGSPPQAIAPPPQPVAPQQPPMAQQPPMPQQPVSGLALLTAAANPAEHPLAPVIRWADDALRQMQGLRDYTATFMKREFVDGRLQEQQVMYAKVRPSPHSVYLQFLAPNDVKGQEALYVAGQNGGNLRAHPVGFKQTLVGTVSLAPNSPQAMEGNRHAITDFGVHRLLERYLEGAMQDTQFGECNVRIIPNAAVNDRNCTCIETTHPQRRREFTYHICRLYVDNQWNLPIRYEGYDWPAQPGAPPQLVEEYTYCGLRLNVGLGAGDFDERNPNYRF